MTTKVGALYSRTSRESDDAFSIAAQRKGNREYAAAHNIYLPEEYEFSEEFTGKLIDRPELNKVRALVKSRAINALIVYVTDRFARKIGVGEFLLEELFEYGVELHIVTWNGPVRDTPEDRARFNFEMLFSDYERRKILARTEQGRLQKLTGSDGIPPAWVGQGPVDKYGYKKLGKKRKTRLVIVEEEARIIVLIFDMYVYQRRGVRAIARYLNGMDIPTRSQAKGFDRLRKEQWSRTDVYKILRDQSYTGIFYANQNVTHVNSKGRRSAIQRPREEWIRLDFPELRIIDDDTFNQAKKLLTEGRQKHAPQPTNQYLLARRLRCQCGYATAVRTDARRASHYSYYFCGRKGRGKEIESGCKMPTIRGDFLEQKVWARLEAFLKNPQEQEETLRRAQANTEEQHSEALTHMREAKAVQTNYERELKAYYEDYRVGLITRNIYLEKKTELDQRLAAAEEVIREYEEQLSTKVLTDQDVRTITQSLARLRSELERLGELDFAKRRKLIEAMNMSGMMRIEEGWQVVYISVYTAHLDTVPLQEIEPGSNPSGSKPNDNSPNPFGGARDTNTALWEENRTICCLER